MKLRSIRIQNYKSIVDLTMQIGNIQALVGENSVGKSNILEALDVFLSNSMSDITRDSFFDPSKKISIEVKFDELTEKEKETKLKSHIDDNKFSICLEIVLENEKPKAEYINPATDRGVIGYKNVLKGNLPDFYYLPAVKDYGDEAKITSTTNAGKLYLDISKKITETEPTIIDAKKHLKMIREKLSKPQEGDDLRPAIIKKLEEDLTAVMRSSVPSIKRVHVNFELDEVLDLMKSGFNFKIDDGHLSDVGLKGHGVQRAMIFSLLKIYLDYLKSSVESEENISSFILGIEEPELFLHPQSQRLFLETMKALSSRDQFIYCTHSSFFIDPCSFENIAVIRKLDFSTGTKAFQPRREIFSTSDDKELYNAITKCNPERNEMFFAKKVILVEGISDKICISKTIDCIDKRKEFNEKGYSIVECGGKGSIPFYQKLLNEFSFDYAVVHDTDSDMFAKDPLTKGINEEINTLASGKKIILFDPRLESEANFQGKMDGYDAYRFFNSTRNINQRLIDKIKTILEC